MEHLAVVRLRALIAQEAEVEQAEAQEVTMIKKAIDAPTTDANECENGHRVLIKVGKSWLHLKCLFLIPDPPQKTQSPLKSKAVKVPHVTVSTYHLALVV